MKKIFLAGAAVLIAAGAFFALSFISDEKESSKETKESAGIIQQVNENTPEEEKHSCCAEEKEEGEYSENSIYQLEAEWLNQNGEKVKLSDFRGRSVVFTMFFASCTYACPILVNDMKNIESRIDPSDLKNYRFVLLSIDPERDTPSKLKEFAEMKGIDEKRWTLLTGSQDDIMEIAALTGFKFKKENDGQFSHSNLINILNEEGEIVHQHTGLNQDVTLASNILVNN